VRNASGFPASAQPLVEGCAFDTLSRRSLERKGKAIPHSRAAKPQQATDLANKPGRFVFPNIPRTNCPLAPRIWVPAASFRLFNWLV
jgi:hypothetical protein